MRGKYQDAKEYFRQAIMVDPTSQVSWKNYDLSVNYALAEKVENNTGLIAPGFSSAASQEIAPSAAPIQALQAPSASQVFTAEDEQEEEEEEEGC